PARTLGALFGAVGALAATALIGGAAGVPLGALLFLAFRRRALLHPRAGHPRLLGARGAGPALTGTASRNVLEVGVGKLVPGALLTHPLLAVLAVVMRAMLVRTVLPLFGVFRGCHGRSPSRQEGIWPCRNTRRPPGPINRKLSALTSAMKNRARGPCNTPRRSKCDPSQA